VQKESLFSLKCQASRLTRNDDATKANLQSAICDPRYCSTRHEA
jgi:hypothetical protein